MPVTPPMGAERHWVARPMNVVTVCQLHGHTS